MLDFPRVYEPITGRAMKVVWNVLDPFGRLVESFPYTQKANAEARAKTLKDHYVQPHKVPV